MNFGSLIPYIIPIAQGSEKIGGYVNKLVVTCLRSGLNRTFRVMQKPERAPIRALRASSSGRFTNFLYTLILLLFNSEFSCSVSYNLFHCLANFCEIGPYCSFNLFQISFDFVP